MSMIDKPATTRTGGAHEGHPPKGNTMPPRFVLHPFHHRIRPAVDTRLVGRVPPRGAHVSLIFALKHYVL